MLIEQQLQEEHSIEAQFIDKNKTTTHDHHTKRAFFNTTRISTHEITNNHMFGNFVATNFNQINNDQVLVIWRGLGRHHHQQHLNKRHDKDVWKTRVTGSYSKQTIKTKWKGTMTEI